MINFNNSIIFSAISVNWKLPIRSSPDDDPILFLFLGTGPLHALMHSSYELCARHYLYVQCRELYVGSKPVPTQFIAEKGID
jgi:hypothetical protein